MDVTGPDLAQFQLVHCDDAGDIDLAQVVVDSLAFFGDGLGLDGELSRHRIGFLELGLGVIWLL